ncbi:unnamed protein product [Peronospora farinosa]|uniref:Uncharacterized protein n=1 Tax=Peronospora farinosa TaxID=134698 RepID=A0AAV0UPN5_9STRA|nr:unnamed protein product [Peronospora farinosa]CAI5737745.1 unnamed protein product [Peronospora farinosa]
MTTTSPCIKSNIFNPCDTTVPTSFLLSPTSVAHRIQMLDRKTGRHAPGNTIRDQWVANLQNKRMAAAAKTGDPVGSRNRLSGTTTSNTGDSNSRSGFATKSSCSRSAVSRVAATSRNAAQSSAIAHEQSLNTRQITAYPSSLNVDSQIAMSDADAITLEQSTMLFNEMGGFELDSPTLSRLISSPTTITKTSKGWMKRGTKKVGSNKRTTHYLALHSDQSNSHTPCRKRNCGSVKSDIFDFDYYSMVSNASNVETPANISVDASCANTRYLWDQDLDFSGAGGYADTFLDSPTPELAETPLVPTSQWSNVSSTTSTSSKQSNDEADAASRFDHLQSFHTSSIEQKGFNQFFEQNNLDGTDDGHDDELHQLATTPLVCVRKSPLSESSCFTPATTAATECCGDKPATLSSSWQMSSPSPISTSSRPDASTTQCRLTLCDQKYPPEFETLMGEYNITDIDHELDGFYLDTMEVIENGLD